jgi:hypothetical protein
MVYLWAAPKFKVRRARLRANKTRTTDAHSLIILAVNHRFVKLHWCGSTHTDALPWMAPNNHRRGHQERRHKFIRKGATNYHPREGKGIQQETDSVPLAHACI